MARRPRVAFEESVAMSTLSPIRMDSWRQQAMLTRGRSLPDIGNASTLHPNLRKLVERKVPLRMPAVGKISDTPTDPVTRRKAVSQPGKELEAHPKYRPSPWARFVTTKVEKRGRRCGHGCSTSQLCWSRRAQPPPMARGCERVFERVFALNLPAN